MSRYLSPQSEDASLGNLITRPKFKRRQADTQLPDRPLQSSGTNKSGSFRAISQSSHRNFAAAPSPRNSEYSPYRMSQGGRLLPSMAKDLDSDRSRYPSGSPASNRSGLKPTKAERMSVMYPDQLRPSPGLASLASEMKKMFEALPQITAPSLSKSMERVSEPKHNSFKVRQRIAQGPSISFNSAYRDSRPRRALPRKATRGVAELAQAQKYFEEFHFKSRQLVQALEASVLRDPNV